MQNDMSNITQKWVDILKPFSEDYNMKLSASELARRSSIPQQSASRYMNNLYNTDLIDCVIEGKNKLFFINKNKKTALTLINLIETQKSIELILNKEMQKIMKYSSNFIVISDNEFVFIEECDKEKINQLDQINYFLSWDELKDVLKSDNELSQKIKNNHVFVGNINKFVDILLGLNLTKTKEITKKEVTKETDDLIEKIQEIKTTKEKKSGLLRNIFNR